MTTTAVRLRAILWIALALALVAVTAASQWIHYRHLWVSSEIEQIRQDIIALTAAIDEDDALQRRAKGLEHRTYANDKRILRMLGDCRTREDFIVREGPRIVWSELRGSSATEKTIGVYLPPGTHQLKFGLAHSADGFPAREFRLGNARGIVPFASVELGAAPEVYEIRLVAKEGDEPVSISVHGEASMPMHTSELKELKGQRHFRSIFEEQRSFDGRTVNETPKPPRELTVCFPSEVVHSFTGGRDFSPVGQPKPVTDLAAYVVLGGNPVAYLRIWIESDARPCLPAITVAAHYPTITGGAFGNQTSRDRERVFSGLFYPYDGSDRFYLRDELFVE